MQPMFLFRTPALLVGGVDHSQKLNGDLIQMLRRAPHYFVIVAAIVCIWVKGTTYVHALRLDTAERAGELLDLAKLVLICAAACLAIYVLVRDRLSKGVEGGAEGQKDFGMASFAGRLRGLQALSRSAFARRPVLASIFSSAMVILLASLPIGLLALGRAGGVRAFGVSDWILLGAAEVPLVCVVSVVLIGLKSNSEPRR